LPAASLGPQSAYLCLPHSWNPRHMPLCPYCLLRWSLTNILPELLVLNHKCPNLCLLSSWVERQVPLILALNCIFFSLLRVSQNYNQDVTRLSSLLELESPFPSSCDGFQKAVPCDYRTDVTVFMLSIVYTNWHLGATHSSLPCGPLTLHLMT
jgi:hypothetical protein